MAVVSMRELLEAGVHFGHQTRRWNPKMKRFIFSERGGIYIIDLQQTQALLQEAHDFARNISERGGSILFVGTKKQAQEAIDLPVSGDPVYGVVGDLGLERQFLHAHRLRFEHPFTGAGLDLRSPLPPDLAEALERARAA